MRKLAEAATPGPWHITSENDRHWKREVRSGDRYASSQVAWCGGTEGQAQKDAAFIAAASPEVVLGLMDEIERLRSVCIAQRDVHVAHNKAMISQHEAESNTLMDIAASVTQERDQWRQVAEQNMLDYQELYRECLDARDAVRRLAGALKENMIDDSIDAYGGALQALADPVVRRIVAGEW